MYLVPIFVLLDVLCELSMPLLMARIVDVGIATRTYLHRPDRHHDDSLALAAMDSAS
jgi:hypothetical protein